MPTPRQLEIFVAVAASGSMRQAAEALDISQPSVSKQLQAMERSLGGELFERRRGEKVRISTLGSALLDDARQALLIHQRFAGLSTLVAQETAPRIFVRNFLLETLKHQLDRLHEAGFPKAAQFILVDESEDIAARVQATAGSYALLRSANLDTGSSLTSLVLRNEDCSIYVSPEIAAQLETGSLQRSELPILVPAAGSEIDLWTRRLAATAGFEANKCTFGSQFIDIQVEKALSGKGAAIFMDLHVKDLVDKGRLKRLTKCAEPLYLLMLANPANDRAIVGRMAEWFRKI